MSQKSAHKEIEVRVGESDMPLKGMLSIPAGYDSTPIPALILVHGSGPHDWDETIGPNKPFKDIADELSGNLGIAVLRYEKRTRAYPDSYAESMEELTVQEEVIDDVLEAFKLLEKRPEIDSEKIFILGHSLGGGLLPRIAEQIPAAAGLISLAGFARPLEDLIEDQHEYMLYLIDAMDEKAWEALPEDTRSRLEDFRAQVTLVKRQVALVKSEKLSKDTSRDDLPLRIPAAYWLDLRGYEPALVASTLTQPMLILQGERDYQVTMVDFQLWQDGLLERGNVTFKTYPDLNHLFLKGFGKGPSTAAEYEIPGHIPREVLQDIGNWCLGNRD